MSSAFDGVPLILSTEKAVADFELLQMTQGCTDNLSNYRNNR